MSPRKMIAFAAVMLFFTSASIIRPASAASEQTSPPDVQAQTIDTRFLITARQLAQKLKSDGTLTIVDVRPSREYARARIPGSLNMPLHFIRTKAFLKKAPFVLVYADMAYRKLEIACRRLRESGFKPLILNGGLGAWVASGGEIAGDLFAAKRFNRIRPEVFHLEKDLDHRLVVDLSGREEETGSLPPDTLKVTGNDSRTTDVIKKLKAMQAEDPYLLVMVLNKNGEDYARIDKTLHENGLLNASYLAGGIAAYESYLEDLALSWQPRASRIVSSDKCGPCGSDAEIEE